MHIIEIFVTFYAGPFNSVGANLEGWRSEIRADFAAENANDDSTTEEDCEIFRAPVKAAIPPHGARILCSAHVHCITNPAHYARNQALQQQAEEAERGQHLEKQLRSAAALINVQAKLGTTTNVENVQFFLRTTDKSAGGGGNDSYIVKTVLRKDEVMLGGRGAGMGTRTVSCSLCSAGHLNLPRLTVALHPHPGCARRSGEGT